MPFVSVESTPERFWRKVEFTDTCWLWTRALTDEGYARFYIGPKRGRTQLIHRWAYEFCVQSIPADLTIDHLCRVRHCVRPEHLEPVTFKENVLRGTSFAAVHARKTISICGHPFDMRDTYGRRRCRPCTVKRQREWRHSKSSSIHGARKGEEIEALLTERRSSKIQVAKTRTE